MGYDTAQMRIDGDNMAVDGSQMALIIILWDTKLLL